MVGLYYSASILAGRAIRPVRVTPLNAYAWPREPQLFAIGLYSVVIFVKHREVFARTILPNFISRCKDSVVFAFWRRHGQKKEKEGTYVRQVLNCFDSIPLANQNNSLGQPK